MTPMPDGYHQVNLRLPEEHYRHLYEMAKAQGKNPGRVAREMLVRAIKAAQQQKEPA